MDDAGLEQAAILLMTVGEEQAAEVFKYLSPKEVQKLGETMARLKTVPRERVDQVLRNFNKAKDEQYSLVGDTDAFISQVLKRALGDEKAGMLLDRILQGRDVSGIESLKWMDPGSIAELLKNEHPQIVASILVHLERDHASEVLKSLPERMRNDVLLRIATLDGIQPQALQELNEVLSKVLAGGEKLKKATLGGTKATAEILNFLGSQLETAAVESIREHDPDLAQRILDQMFVFENLMDLDDRAIQLLLREVQSESLIVALKGADPALREKIFKNMSNRAAEMLREDLEAKGPVRLSEVEAEQREILKIVRRLADEGQIQLGSGGDDEYV
ncbi:flagellar motor switch protein FliG [Betaproteobacteria bacterium PRO7]|jgi:flagellar motor switch protein FliG|nr:flagellar motor switch protein FliG [Burkholderiaceae bacterium]MDL1860382.1 flagellar motor switch protein FliG [Betaproteobacteria bacterium PRO7]GIK84896.1 MAG: flagellar motor switch protein G [Betaproteobacteria bacterium]